MSFAAQFRQCLQDGDLAALRGLWAQVMPHLPQPQTDAQALIVMHRARTEAQSVTFRARAWSHRWLTERALPSGLPDGLKPRAERLYPVIVDAVGICVKASSELMKPAARMIQQAMSDAVADAYAEGRKDPVFVRQRMKEARGRVVDRLFG